jgi:DNA replication and repair protein RecF
VHVAHLSLLDFRSYREVELPLRAGVTTFVGPNGQGKTNLVEAIGYLATLDSHRVSGDAALVRAGAERAVVRAKVVRDERTALLEVEINPGRSNRARINGSPQQRARDLIGVLRTVLFAPEDLALVKGDPSDRRRFLDELLVLRTPRLAGVRADYERVLKQRNALLKSMAGARRSPRGLGEHDLSTLDVWDEQLVATGSALVAARRELVRALRPRVESAYSAVAPSGGATDLTYRSTTGAEVHDLAAGTEPTAGADDEREQVAAAMRAVVADSRKQEIERGVSLVGPHRDDLVLTLRDLPAKGYASHGESWSFALALRLASYELLRTDGTAGGEPILVLDDVFAELDAARRERLAELVADAEQVLITAAVPGDVPSALRGDRVDVAAGSLRPAS